MSEHEQARPPAPPIHHKPVASATHECPLLARKECDVEQLKIDLDIEGQRKYSKPKLELTAKRMMRRDPLPAAVKDPHVKDLLGRYDIVIDVICGYPSRERLIPLDLVKLTAEAEWEGICAFHAHPVLAVKPINYKAADWATEMAKKVGERSPEFARAWVEKGVAMQATQLKTGVSLERREIVMKRPGAHELKIDRDPDSHDQLEYFANPLMGDYGEGSGGIFVVFDILGSLWPMHTPAVVEVVADSCGKRLHAERSNRNLIGAVRIFRKDSIEVGFKLPPLGSYQHEREGTVSGLGKHREVEFESKTELSKQNIFDGAGNRGRWRDKRTETSKGDRLMSWHGGEEQQVSKHAVLIGHGGGRQSNDNGVQFDHAKVAGPEASRLEQIETALNKYDIGVILKRNGQDIDLLEEDWPEGEVDFHHGKGPNKLDKAAHPTLARMQHEGGHAAAHIGNKRVRDLVVKGLANGARMMGQVLDFIHKMPQMGWKFEFDVSICAGRIVANWAPYYVDEPAVPGRYLAVEHRVALKFDVNLIHFVAALSFGVQAKAVGTGVTLKAVGELSLDLPITAQLVLSLHAKPNPAILVRPTSQAKIELIGDASALGFTVAHVQGGVEVGFTMGDGKLDVSLHAAPRVRGTLVQTPLDLTWWYVGPIRPPKPPGHKELWGEHVIHKFE